VARTRRTLSALVAPAVITAMLFQVASCSLAARQPSPAPSASGLAVPPSVSGASPSPITNTEKFEFVRWNSDNLTLVTEPGSDVVVAKTGDEPIAAVLDRTVVDGMEWIRVQVGRGYAQDFVVNGWAPYAADLQKGGRSVHVEPAYEFIEPDCPKGPPTVQDLDGMLPLQSLHCFGSRELTFSAVHVREEGDELSAIVDGTPDWLVEGGNLVMYWLPEWHESGSIRIYLNPGVPVEVPEHTWLEIKGHLDDEAAQSCRWDSDYPEFAVANDEEATQICRTRLVVTAARPLTAAEIPPSPPVTGVGPEPEVSVAVETRSIEAPVAAIGGAATVWTGSDLLVWGGWEARKSGSFRHLKNGWQYTPSSGVWQEIPSAPVAGRARPLAAWTGSELLVWGGNLFDDEPVGDGAAYNPATDAWRKLAQSPMTWRWTGASTWTGTEWWIAAEHEGGGVSVAAYNPESDTWRQLPSVEDIYADVPAIAWTGSEILLSTAAGLFRMPAGGAEWLSVEWDVHEPVLWTGELFVGAHDDNLSEQPLGFDYLSHPIGWDPATGATVQLAVPPRSVYSPVLVGQHLAYFEEKLALNLTTNEWVNLDVNRAGQKALSFVGGTAVWAGDRLIVWGGEDACFGPPADPDVLYELIPAWETGDVGVAAARRVAAYASMRHPTDPDSPGTVNGPPIVVAAC